MGRQGSDTYLHESGRQPGFHNACKGAGVGMRVSFKSVVEVGMSIDMQYFYRTVCVVKSPKQGVGNGMISTQGY